MKIDIDDILLLVWFILLICNIVVIGIMVGKLFCG